MTTVLVTGATGNVGSKVVRSLHDRGADVRAFVRDRNRAAAVLGPGVRTVTGDFADPASIRAALSGVATVFLTSGDGPGKVAHQRNVIDAAAAAGVRRIVALSAAGSEKGSSSGFWHWQGQIEEHLWASGVPAVLLQSCFFMSNLLAAAGAIRQTGRLFAPAGGARIAMIDPSDVAAAAAVVLTENGHEGRTYVLTGPQAITYDDIARHLSDLTGRPIPFVDVPDEAARQAMRAEGMPDWLADSLIASFAVFRRGGHAQEQPTEAVSELTGRPPRSFAAFLRDHAYVFTAAGDPPALRTATATR